MSRATTTCVGDEVAVTVGPVPDYSHASRHTSFSLVTTPELVDVATVVLILLALTACSDRLGVAKRPP